MTFPATITATSRSISTRPDSRKRSRSRVCRVAELWSSSSASAATRSRSPTWTRPARYGGLCAGNLPHAIRASRIPTSERWSTSYAKVTSCCIVSGKFAATKNWRESNNSFSTGTTIASTWVIFTVDCRSFFFLHSCERIKLRSIEIYCTRKRNLSMLIVQFPPSIFWYETINYEICSYHIIYKLCITKKNEIKNIFSNN